MKVAVMLSEVNVDEGCQVINILLIPRSTTKLINALSENAIIFRKG